MAGRGGASQAHFRKPGISEPRAAGARRAGILNRMSLYADSSFLVSCYLTDANTPQAKSYLLTVTAPITFTSLQSLEVRNAIKLGVFRQLYSFSDATAAWANLEKDLQSGRLVKKVVKWPVAFRVASLLGNRHSATIGTRSLDVLHVATAKFLRVAEFISFDSRQRTLATTVGLKVAP
jgi:predicted nucleic acid-binding protein